MAKSLDMMGAAELQRAYDKVSAEGSAICREFIDAGRGNETGREIRVMTDPLAVRHTANAYKFSAVVQEMAARKLYHGGTQRIIRKAW